MKPKKTINLPDWLNSTELKMVMDVLGGDSMLVGGCVRNAVIGRKATDIDIATKHRPGDVIQKLEALDIKAIPTGLDHGTITAVVNKKPFEITTLRKDVETDGRHAVVTFADNWIDDAQRRDFTMNTLLMDLDGQVFDPTGHGLNDLGRGRVIFVGEAEQRIREDYLRILRFFRFHAWFGNGDMDADALVACGKHVDKIVELSKERITQEVLKLLSANQPVSVLEIMFNNNVLSNLFHVKHDLKILDHYYAFQDIDVMSALFILSAFDAGHWSDLQQIMVFSNAQKKQFKTLAEGVERLSDVSSASVKKLIYRYGNKATTQIVQIYCAKQGADISNDISELLQGWDAPAFPITGDDLIKDGYEPGPELGKKLKELEDEWLKAF